MLVKKVQIVWIIFIIVIEGMAWVHVQPQREREIWLWRRARFVTCVTCFCTWFTWSLCVVLSVVFCTSTSICNVTMHAPFSDSSCFQCLGFWLYWNGMVFARLVHLTSSSSSLLLHKSREPCFVLFNLC